MKKALIFGLALAFVFTFTAPIFADIPKSIDKLVKGTTDIVKSPIVLYDHTKKEIDGADYKALGLIKGLAEAPFHMVKKAGKGLLDVITFPIE